MKVNLKIHFRNKLFEL